MSNNAKALAALHLDAVLAMMPHLVRYDAEAQAIALGQTGTIRFSAPGVGSAGLHFTGGAVEYLADGGDAAKVSLMFPTAEALNSLFTNKGIPWMLPWGAWHVNLLGAFAKLGKRLEYFVKAPVKFRSDPQALPMLIRLLTTAASRGVAALAQHDEESKHLLAGYEGVAELRLKASDDPAFGENGWVAVRFAVKGGVVAVTDGLGDGGNVLIEIPNPLLAFDLLTGTLDTMAALNACDITTSGKLRLFDQIAAVMDRVDRIMKEAAA